MLAAIEAVLVAKGVPEKKREAVIAAATEQLAQRMRDGQAVPKIKVYDQAAPSQRAVPVPAPRCSALGSGHRRGEVAMDASITELRVTAPPSVYEVGGQRLDAEEPAFRTAIAAAHASKQRPLCLCVDGGVEIYVARLASPSRDLNVKRMPDTGSRHAPHCPSYEPPAELSGLGQVLGSAIVEDPATGETTLKLDFALSRLPGRSTVPPAEDEGGSVRSDGTKLSLRGLLHFLWNQAELTRWQPAFAGRRSWSRVRKHLLTAAEHKVAKGNPLLQRLYVQEVFSVEQRDAINARRAVVTRSGEAGQAAAADADDRGGQRDRAGAVRVPGDRQARAGSGVHGRRAVVPAAEQAIRGGAGDVGRGGRSAPGDDRDVRPGSGRRAGSQRALRGWFGSLESELTEIKFIDEHR